MGLFQAIGTLAGGIVGAGAQQGDKDREEAAYANALNANRYNTDVAGQTGTEFDKIDPQSRNAMLTALNDYQNQYKQGGLDAVARANLARGVSEAEQANQAGSNQVLGQAARAGRLQGPAAMIAAQVAGQQGAERARMSGMETGALAQQGREHALQGSMGAASGVYGMDANRAAAQDAINQFNVNNAQRNVANKRMQVEDQIGINERQADMYGGRQRRDVSDFTGIGKGVGGGVDSIAKSIMSMGGGGGDMGAAGGFGTGSSALGEGVYQVDPTGGSGST